MSHLIYRGVTHDGSSTSRPRTARDMTYRGVRHDGLPAALHTDRAGFAMVYRGVRYMVNEVCRDGRHLPIIASDQRASLLAA